jgi:hypothetical protein
MHMRKWWFAGIFALVIAVGFAPTVSAQESAAKGSLSGTVVDSTGGSIPGATVTLTGPQGVQTATTNTAGGFTYQVLIPTSYSVKVEMKNFRSAVVPSIEVFTGRNTEIRVVLEPGTVTQTVEVVSSAVTVDTTSTAVATNLNDTFYQKLPVQRGVAGLFYLAPGVVSGGGTGASNPSISGATGLENMYVADGVSITDTAFGGIGIFSRVYGSLGTGINLAFIKEVQVKTAAFQPQYGGATGGVIQIVTKSGGHDYHGAISAFYQPQQFEAQRSNPDDFGLANKTGLVLHNAGADLSGEVGGSVPGLRDKLFFFGSIDPSETQTLQIAPVLMGNFAFGALTGRTLTYNYAGKLTFKISDKHSIEGSVFGDPAHTNRFPWDSLRFGVTGFPNTSGFSKLVYGNRDTVARYNGTLSPTWVLNASITWQHNDFKESGYNNSISQVIVQTQIAGLPGQQGQFNAFGRGFVENTEDESYSGNINTTKIFNLWGQHALDLGFQYTRAYYDGARSNSGPALPAPIVNENGDCLGTSTPGPCSVADTPAWSGLTANYVWRLLKAPGSCTDCPFMTVPGIGPGGVPGNERVVLRMFRSEFGVSPDGFKHFVTSSRYHVGYINDTWTLNKHVTLNAGIRWQEERMVGQDSKFTFTDDWSPRIGVDVDPVGDRKNKIYFNFGRYSYNLPLDLAERSLTNELDLFSFRIAPNFTTVGCPAGENRCVVLNSFGSVTPVVDSAHVLNQAANGVPQVPFASLESIENIHSGTKLTYEDEYVFGAEHEFPHGILASVRYVHRSLRRIVEDTGGIAPEAALAGVPQQFSITNPSKSLDIFTNPIEHHYKAAGGTPAACAPGDFTATNLVDSQGNPITDQNGNNSACFSEVVAGLGANTFGIPIGVGGCALDPVTKQPVPGKCNAAGSVIPDGIPDGFSDPVHKYWSVEFEVNKSFSHNWQLRANYRIAKLFGNFEGAFRNDNGQSDPGISSLFDFTPGEFGMLGQQFAPGVLNTDRQQVANGYFSYLFDRGMLKNLTLGTGIRVQTGTPVNELAAHPVYDNAGEVPIGGRGSQGRTPTYGSVDLHADYVFNVTEKAKLRFGVDMFNLGNTKRILFINQNIDLGTGTTNLDFLKPANQAVRGDGIQSPFNARVFFRLEF